MKVEYLCNVQSVSSTFKHVFNQCLMPPCRPPLSVLITIQPTTPHVRSLIASTPISVNVYLLRAGIHC